MNCLHAIYFGRLPSRMSNLNVQRTVNLTEHGNAILIPGMNEWKKEWKKCVCAGHKKSEKRSVKKKICEVFVFL